MAMKRDPSSWTCRNCGGPRKSRTSTYCLPCARAKQSACAKNRKGNQTVGTEYSMREVESILEEGDRRIWNL